MLRLLAKLCPRLRPTTCKAFHYLAIATQRPADFCSLTYFHKPHILSPEPAQHSWTCPYSNQRRQTKALPRQPSRADNSSRTFPTTSSASLQPHHTTAIPSATTAIVASHQGRAPGPVCTNLGSSTRTMDHLGDDDSDVAQCTGIQSTTSSDPCPAQHVAMPGSNPMPPPEISCPPSLPAHGVHLTPSTGATMPEAVPAAEPLVSAPAAAPASQQQPHPGCPAAMPRPGNARSRSMQGRAAVHPGEALGVAVKGWEGATDMVLPEELPFVVRLDGVSFRTYTRGMRKPCDTRLSHALLATTVALTQRFHPVTAFCCSDEITLVFPPLYGGEEDEEVRTQHPRSRAYSGRVQKLSSVMAAVASARFNMVMARQSWDDVPPATRAQVMSHSAAFDARVFPVPGPLEAMQCVYWRQVHDCMRNAISAYAKQHMSHKEMHRMPAAAARQWLLDHQAFDVLRDAPPLFVHGCFVKAEKYKVEAVNRHTGEAVMASRRRIRCATLRLDQDLADDEARAGFVMAKLWPEGVGGRDVALPPAVAQLLE